MKAVVSLAEWLNALLVTGLGIALVVVMTKFVADPVFKVPGIDVEVNVGYAWIIFSAMTLAHVYVTVLFVRACRHVFRAEQRNARQTFECLSSNGPLFFRGLMPRLLEPNTNTARMRLDDLTTWLAHCAALVFLGAIVPVPSGSPLLMLPAVLLIVINWLLASRWVIAASELTLVGKHTRIL